MLVYDRIAQNRRKTLLLPLAVVALGAPFMLALSLAVSGWMVGHLGRAAGAALDKISAGRPRYQLLPPPLPQTAPTQTPVEPDLTLQIAIALFAAAVPMAACLLLWKWVSTQTPKLLGAYGAEPAPAEAQRILESLAIGAGLHKPKLYVVDGAAPNAFAVGDNSAHSIIGVTRGLLSLMDHRELEGVLAHELSHIGNHDTGLNATVTSLTLFLRLPKLLWQRHVAIEEQTHLQVFSQPVNVWGTLLLVLLSPVLLYFFLLAPLVGALIRSAISRDREFLADADAALLTRYPEGLIRALAKIQGAGSHVAASPAVAHFYFADAGAAHAVFTTHPPVEQRIARLAEIHGEFPPDMIEAAVRAGQTFAREHISTDPPPLVDPAAQDEVSALNMGNVMGRVYRLVGSPATVYDKPDVHSPVNAQITAGSLLIVFDDPGPFRQVLTADRTFGYLPRSIKLEPVDMLPSEV